MENTGQEPGILVRKIDCGLDEDAQLHDLRGQGRYFAREFAGKGANCCARRFRGSRTDQVRDRLGLREIDLVIQESPLAEFAGSRRPGT